MKHMKTIYAPAWCAVASLSAVVFGSDAFAAEEVAADGFRPVWDEIMLWVNFAILVFVIVKYGRKPIMNFLRGQKADIERQIVRIEKEKEEIENQIRDTRKAVEESETRFEGLKRRIIEQGERRKVQIIEDAKSQSEIMLEMSKRKIEGQVKEARESFKAEMVDAAVDMALERLPKEITDEDNQRFVDQYLSAT